MNDESMRQMMTSATKRARVARVFMMAMRVVGDNESKGGTGHGIGDKSGVQKRG
jgi:hypothetical protein